MTKYYIIQADGIVHEHEYSGPLEYKCIPWDRITNIIAASNDTDPRCTSVEHVGVSWKGKRCHMFVDELGKYKNLQPNIKASRVYWNWPLRSNATLQYTDLKADPKLSARTLVPQLDHIVGTALLWEGDME